MKLKTMKKLTLNNSRKFTRPICPECSIPLVRKGKRLCCKECSHHELSESLEEKLVRVGYLDHLILSPFLTGHVQEQFPGFNPLHTIENKGKLEKGLTGKQLRKILSRQ